MANEKELINLKLEYLNETKAIIKNAIIEKGQAVGDEDTFRDYAQKILDIQSGGGTDTGDATATVDDILEGVTAYIATGKVSGNILKSFKVADDYNTYLIEDLTKSLSYNFGVSNDGKYLADFRTVNGVNTLIIYKFDEQDRNTVIQVATTITNLPDNTTNPDIKFSPIVDGGLYRFSLSCGRYMSVYEFDRYLMSIKHLVTTDLTGYTNNQIYQIAWSNHNVNMVAVIHSQTQSSSYNPRITLQEIIYDSEYQTYSYNTKWTVSFPTRQCGHQVYWAEDDKAICYNNTHEGYTGAGYVQVGENYVQGTQTTSWTRQCAVDLTNGHRIVDFNIQNLSNGSWVTTGTLPSTPSDPDFVVLNSRKNLAFVGSSTSNVDHIYVYEIGWLAGTATLKYTLNIPTNHIYFGYSYGSQQTSLIGFSTDRFMIYGRKTIPYILEIYFSNDFDWLERNEVYYRNLNELQNNAGPEQVLSGYKYYNSDFSVGTGTLVNRGSRSFVPTTETQTADAGYYSSISVASVDSSTDYSECLSLTTAILDGVQKYLPAKFVDTGTGNATADDVREGKIAFANGNRVVGAIDTSTLEKFSQKILDLDTPPIGVMNFINDEHSSDTYFTYYKPNVGYIVDIVDKDIYPDIKFYVDSRLTTSGANLVVYCNYSDIQVDEYILDEIGFEAQGPTSTTISGNSFTIYRKDNTLIPYFSNIKLYKDNTFNVALFPAVLDLIKDLEIENDMEYGFAINQDGYYESEHYQGGESTYIAYTKLKFNVTGTRADLRINYKMPMVTGSSMYANYCRAYVSLVDTDLTYTTNADNNLRKFYTTASSTMDRTGTIEYLNIPKGEHYITVKFLIYRYYGSEQDEANFQFKPEID